MNILIRTLGRIKEFALIIVSAGSGDAGKPVGLDAAGKLDASVMPAGFGQNTKTATANGALSARDLVYIEAAGTMAKADATTEGKEAIGFVSAAVSNAAVGTIYLTGNNITGLSGLTPGKKYYLSTTPGLMVDDTAAPVTGGSTGNVVQEVGTALSATELAFEPEQPITLA